jgi:hypothetical protein
MRIRKKNRKDAQPGTKAPNGVEIAERRYPAISPDEEWAVIQSVAGLSYRQIAEIFGIGHSSVGRWFLKPEVQAAEAMEREMRIAEIRAQNPDRIAKAYAQIDRGLNNEIHPQTMRVALDFLERTGFLITSDDKQEQDRKKRQLAEQLADELYQMYHKRKDPPQGEA